MDTRKKQFALGAVCVLVAGLLVAWWNQNQPEKSVHAALAKLKEAQTQEFSSRIYLGNNETTKEVLGEEGHIEVSAEGAYKKQDGAPALEMDLVVTIKTESVSVQLAGETRFIDDKAYVLINKTPSVFPALAGLKDTWIELKRGGVAEESGTRSLQQNPDEPLFTSIARAGSEVIQDTPTKKYTAHASQDAVIQMMDSIASLLGTQLTGKQVEELKVSVQKIQSVPVELWIARNDELKQLSTVLAVPDGNTVRFSVTFGKANMPVDIRAPEQFKQLGEVLGATTQTE